MGLRFQEALARIAIIGGLLHRKGLRLNATGGAIQRSIAVARQFRCGGLRQFSRLSFGVLAITLLVASDEHGAIGVVTPAASVEAGRSAVLNIEFRLIQSIAECRVDGLRPLAGLDLWPISRDSHQRHNREAQTGIQDKKRLPFHGFTSQSLLPGARS